MPRLEVSSFLATLPRISEDRLPPGYAQVAENTDLHKGVIRAFRDVGDPTALTSDGEIKTVFLWRAADLEYWLRFTDDVDVARSPIADDENRRVYWTGDMTDVDGDGEPYPRMSYTPAVYTGGTDYPVISYRLGVPAPSLPPVAAVTGSTTDPDTAEARFYVKTYVTELGEEGPPSEPSIKVMVADGQSVNLSGLGLDGTDGFGRNITLQRIYRTNEGNDATAFQFVAELPIATDTYSDTLDGDELAEVIPSVEWYPPPAGMRGIRMMANGVMVGFKGNEVCFSDPFLPHAWPVSYRLTVDSKIVAIGTFENSVVVATEGRPVLITGADPASMSQRDIQIIEPCVSKASMVSLGHGCCYASRNGIVYISPSQQALVTAGMVSKEEWAQFEPGTIRACEYRQQYLGFHGTGGASGRGFFFNPLNAESGITTLGLRARAVHRDPLNERAYLLDWDNNVRVFEDGDHLLAVWRSPVFSEEKAWAPTAIKVRAKDFTDTEIRVYADGELYWSGAITDDRVRRMPRGERSAEWEIEIRTRGEVRVVSMAESVGEL